MTPLRLQPFFLLRRGVLFLVLSAGVAWVVGKDMLVGENTASFNPRTLTARAVALHSDMPPAEGADCRACHPRIVSQWETSQHALANRLIADHPLPAGSSQFGDVTTVIGADGTLEQTMLDGSTFTGKPVAVIGVEPLVQALVDVGEGRWQVFNPAAHTETDGWFNAFSDVRHPNDWGHWSGQAMNWNSRCAWCHMTDFEKNYDPETDQYDSSWQAMGISCAQCHGDSAAHAANPSAVPAGRFDRSIAQENCISCHARREFITAEDFHAGEKFNDHFRLALFDTPDVYYPDGQIQDENFEAASFLSSRMHDAGVTCFDCHNPHSGKLTLPTDNNALCMSCHTAPGRMGAPAILPTAHSHHAEGSLGNRCVECHMPQTQYMQSDWRRDHGFHSPDPLLTEELGIPNACARCHEDQTVAWAVEKTEAWYGEALENKGYRERTRTVAAARAQTPGTGKALITAFQKETNAIWRASLVRLMEPFLREPGVTDVVETALQDPEAQVRAAAVQTLRMLPGSEQRLLALREDPVREVRLNAVWATLEAPGMRPGNKAELEAWLNFNSDDVVGRLNQAQAAWRRGQVDQMQQWLSRMRELDDSAGPNMMAGRMLYAAGLPEEAGSRFERAVEADPENVEAWFVLGMLRGEGRRIDDAIEAFRRAVLLDPAFGRAWYNLGLAQVQTGDEQAGLLSLRRAEATQPGSADAAYAAATVHARAGRLDEAVAALQRGLLQQPSHGPSLQLLRQLGR